MTEPTHCPRCLGILVHDLREDERFCLACGHYPIDERERRIQREAVAAYRPSGRARSRGTSLS